MNSLYAKRWPLTIVTNNQKNIFTSKKKKYVMRSQARLKHTRICKSASIIFSPFLFAPLQSEKPVLHNLFLDARKKRSTKVRVLLTKIDRETSSEWKFVSSEGFIIQVENDAGKIKKIIKASVLTIKIKQGCLFCNGKRITGTLYVRPIAGHGEYNGTMYDGDFIIIPYKNTFLCINQVELEDYVNAVLRTESWPGWPLEINKVFAIACRSYVMFKVLEAQQSGRPYHVKNTNAHQTYRGKHELPVIKMAVAQTRGVALGFKGLPILAMFDCCCGGIIPANIADFDFDKVPYLARTYACNYCKQSSLYSWQVSYDQAAFEIVIKEFMQKIVRLSHIYVIKKDKAGLIIEVLLKGPKETVTISGKKLYSLLKEVKSFYFDIQKKSNKIIFTGRGFGHHMGLCQWGARQMVEDGWGYKSILRFYYPGAYFMHLI